ncbi:putative aldo/keto reductase [Xylariales sp. PMI_506]|nr:putative aldo/keto reductase [Xylariales sp. PMI_506]
MDSNTSAPLDSAPPHPTIYYGTAFFGSSYVPALQDPDSASEFLDAVQALGIAQLDTVARYPSDNHGRSERTLGAAGAHGKGFTISSKVLFPGQSSDGTLSREAPRAPGLGIEKLDILYAHVPDKVTPLEEQMEVLSEQVEKGYCERIGLSNFPPDLVEQMLAICDDKGLVKPTVYQGQYNLICRGEVEKDLLPVLRRHGIAFNAFSPLGGGFLTGKLTSGEAAGTRLGSAYGAHFRGWYDREEFHAAVHALQGVLAPLGISTVGAALRWIAYHSALQPDRDGIILGATKVEQIQSNVADIAAGPLPQVVIDEIKRIRVTVADLQDKFQVNPAALPPR